METTSLNLGSQIAMATLNIALDQQKAKGQAAVQLIEAAASVQLASPAPQTSSALGGTININV